MPDSASEEEAPTVHPSAQQSKRSGAAKGSHSKQPLPAAPASEEEAEADAQDEQKRVRGSNAGRRRQSQKTDTVSDGGSAGGVAEEHPPRGAQGRKKQAPVLAATDTAETEHQDAHKPRGSVQSRRRKAMSDSDDEAAAEQSHAAQKPRGAPLSSRQKPAPARKKDDDSLEEVQRTQAPKKGAQRSRRRKAEQDSDEAAEEEQQDADAQTPARGSRSKADKAPAAPADGEQADPPDLPAASGDDSEASEKAPKKKRSRGAAKETSEQRVARLHPEIQSVWQSLGNVHATAPAAQPPALLLPLLPFQLEGVGWMVAQEDTVFHGGILADDMGMGKTLQTIALLLTRPRSPALIVCPTVAVLQWQAELQTHTKPGCLSVLVYHGASRTRDEDILQACDVVLTTYAIVESDYRREHYKSKKGPLRSPLHAITWGRIVLDEAHFIKDRSSNTARAVFNLSGQAKWSLSGTPLQNRVGELYSLIRFLRADPYSFYFCKQCPCKSLSWKFTDHRNCDACGHKSMSHFCWWNREILKPIQKYGSLGPGQLAYDHLGQLLRAAMLRRTKTGRGDELGLPPRVVTTRRDLFSPEEEDVYEALYSASRTKFVGYVQAGTLLNNYAHIFELLMRMRLAANHPWLVTLRAAPTETAAICVVCRDEAEDAIVSSCKHVFCRQDAALYLSSCAGTPQCPSCFRPLTIDLTQPTMAAKQAVESAAAKRRSIVSRMDVTAWQSSTKIEALLEELHRLQSDDKTIKSIVFSQFTQFLDLLEWRLERAGLRCVKLDGRMAPVHRAAAIEAFNTKPELVVFLISLKAGGVALNLTAASRVFLMDPWWNPAVESQAMDRIHRLGQHRPIVVTRLLVQNSIESRIDQLQEKKHLLFQGTVGMDEASLNRLTEEDLQFLFVL